MPQIRLQISLIRPVQLLLALLFYWMGVGLARYLGATIQPAPQFVGGGVVLIILAVSNLLFEYFRPFNEPIIQGETRKEREQLRAQLLITSLSLLIVCGALVFMLQQAGYLDLDSALLLVLLVFLALANAVPPLRLMNRGLGELSTAVQISSLSSSLAFLLQFGSLHRLLTIFTIPLFLLTLSYFIAMSFPGFSDDLKYERRTLLMRLTWQRAVPIHNFMVFAAFLLLAGSPFLGVPVALVWPAMLTLPLAAYQVYVLRGIADGAKPVWPVFVATATGILTLTVYLVALTFWLR